MKRMLRVVFPVLTLSFVAAATGCNESPEEIVEPEVDVQQKALDTLKASQKKWQDLKWSAYRFEYERKGTGKVHATITVEGGKVTAAVDPSSKKALDSLEGLPTIESLFGHTQKDLEGKGERNERVVLAKYDAEKGYPTMGQYSTNTDGWSFTIKNVAPLEASPAQKELDAAVARWKDAKAKGYRFLYEELEGEGKEEVSVRRLLIEVRDGKVKSATTVADRKPVEKLDDVPTIDTLLERVSAALKTDQAKTFVSASYDEKLGAPKEVKTKAAKASRFEVEYVLVMSDTALQAEKDLPVARAKWAEAKIADYSYEYKHGGFLEAGHFRVEVKGGKATKVTLLHKNGEVAKDPAAYPTLEGFFDKVQDGLPGGKSILAFTEGATFDEKDGHVLRLDVSNGGETWSYEVTAFTPANAD